MAFDNLTPVLPKHFVDSSRFLGYVFPCPSRQTHQMAEYIASESDISDPSMETETTYVESQDKETSLGSSADKRSRYSILSTVVILLVELCERLTYYTLAGTQKVYLQNQLDRSPSTSAAMNSVFSIWDCSQCFRARFDIFRTFFFGCKQA